MTGSNISFDFPLDNSTWIDVKKQMELIFTYTVQQNV